MREIQAGAVAFAALRSDGTVVAWGDPAATPLLVQSVNV